MEWVYERVSKPLLKEKIKKWGTSKLLTTILIKKGLFNRKKREEFLNPDISNFRNPFEFEMMEEVVKRIINARKRKEKVFIYGDYDVDGITATMFLVLVFRQIGIDTEYYIPSRMDEGYGVDKKTIDIIKKASGKLIVTVDTGVNSKEDVEYARNLGIDIIVTDHHKSVKERVDEGVLSINPKLSEKYQFKYLSGAGVALKVAQAVYMKLNENMHKLYAYMDIVMIGTVADVVPMIDENRIIIKRGLETLKKTKVKGLVYLMRYLKLHRKEVTTTDISYFVSPLINSLGRLGNSRLGADFFVKFDEFEIYNIIEEMKKSNRKRRELERTIYEEANRMILKDKQANLKYGFVASDKWHPGIIGVVASRLSSKYNMPIVMITLKDGIAKASCRSVPTVNIFEILEKVEDKLIRFGGHDLAAGFIASESRLAEIKDSFDENIKEVREVVNKTATLEIDMQLSIEQITGDAILDLDRLTPFGVENRAPHFLDYNVEIVDINYFGVEDRHFTGYLIKSGKKYPVVAFDLSHKLDIKNAKSYNIVYSPERSWDEEFREQHQIRLKDLKPIK